MSSNEEKPMKIEREENKAWIDMLDSLADFICASRTMIRIMNDRFVGSGNTIKAANSSPGISKVLPHLDDTIKEIHVNSAFNKTSPMTNYANIIQSHSNNKLGPRFPRHHSASQFLDEQYHLTKQTIARRFRPLATSPNSRNTLMKGYVMNDTFTEGVYRINSPNVRSLHQERYSEVPKTDYSYSVRKERQFR